MPQFILPHANRDSMIKFDTLDSFVQGYIEAAFFTGIEGQTDTDDSESVEIEGLGFDQLDAESLAGMVADCVRFQLKPGVWDALQKAYDHESDYDESQAGRDYWFTRNGHGVGYWDRGLGDIGDTLTEAAQHDDSDLFAVPCDPDTGNPLPGYHVDHDTPSEAQPDPDDSDAWLVCLSSRVEPLSPDELQAWATLNGDTIPARLEYLRGQIQAESLSYSEIAELQDLAAHIDPGDLELLQWAGVPESDESDAPNTIPAPVLALTSDSLAYFAQRLIEGQDIAESWEDATNALPMPPAIQALARAARNPAPVPALESAPLESVIRAALRVDDDGPHIGDSAELLYMIQRGKHHTESQALEAAQTVARELKELAQALETAH